MRANAGQNCSPVELRGVREIVAAIPSEGERHAPTHNYPKARRSERIRFDRRLRALDEETARLVSAERPRPQGDFCDAYGVSGDGRRWQV
jgi:hypothetical protein